MMITAYYVSAATAAETGSNACVRKWNTLVGRRVALANQLCRRRRGRGVENQ